MSFQVASSCYDTALSANQASAAGSIGQLINVGNASYVVDVSTVSATSITYLLRDVSKNATITKVATVTPLPCQLLEVGDGIAIAWGVALSWILSAAIMYLRKGMHE